MAGVGSDMSRPGSPLDGSSSPIGVPKAPGGPSESSPVAKKAVPAAAHTTHAHTITSMPHEATTKSTIATTAVGSVLQSTKKEPVAEIGELLAAFSSSPPKDGNLKNHPEYRRFVQLFATSSVNELVDVRVELQRQGTTNPQYQELVAKMASVLNEALACQLLLQKNPTATDFQNAFHQYKRPQIVADMIEAQSKVKGVPLPEAFAAIKPFLLEVAEAEKYFRSQDVAGLLRMSLKGQDAAFFAAKIHVSNDTTEITRRQIKISNDIRKIERGLEEGEGMIIPAQALFRKLKQEEPESAQVVLEHLRNKFKTEEENFASFESGLKESDPVWAKKATEAMVPVDTILAALGAKSPIAERYYQVERATAKSAQFESGNTDVELELVPYDVMRLALLIESSQTVNDVAQRYFHAKDSGVARDVHFDWAKKKVTIISDPNASQLKAKGTYKKAVSAVIIPLDSRALKDSQAAVQLTPTQVTESLLKNIEKELPFYKELEDVEGVAKLRSVVVMSTHQMGKPQEPVVVKKYSLVFERADKGDLEAVLKGKPSDELRLNMAGQLVQTMSEIHKKGVIHGDLKPANILVNAENRLKVTDFGLSYMVKAGQKITPHYTAAENSYGAWWYTPFDLLKRDPTVEHPISQDIDHYKKVESWVVGCMLHEMVLGPLNWTNSLIKAKYPPQVHITHKELPDGDIEPLDKPYNKLSSEKLKAFADEYKNKITDQVKANPANPKEHILYVVSKLLDMDPKDPNGRWSLEQAKNYLQDHGIGGLNPVAQTTPEPTPAAVSPTSSESPDSSPGFTSVPLDDRLIDDTKQRPVVLSTPEEDVPPPPVNTDELG